MEARNQYPFSNSYHLNLSNYGPNHQFQSNILNVLAILQNTVDKQNVMLQYLLAQQQKMQENSFYQQSSPIQFLEDRNLSKSILQRNTSETETSTGDISSETSEQMLKEEETHNSVFNLKRESSDQTVSSIDNLIIKQELSYDAFSNYKEDDQFDELKTKEGVLRRNNFKSKEKGKKKKNSDNEEKRKSNKLIVPKFPPSKSKHLWINYGRRILDFALCYTKGDENYRIRSLVGKLSSKRDFKEVFEAQESDSEKEKEFKISFAKLALNFIELSAEEAFESSNYRDSLLIEKSRVSSWIQHVAGLDF